jgi:hypothetical protein
MWLLDNSETQNHQMRHIITARFKKKPKKGKILQKNSKHRRKSKKFKFFK